MKSKPKIKKSSKNKFLKFIIFIIVVFILCNSSFTFSYNGNKVREKRDWLIDNVKKVVQVIKLVNPL